MRLRNRLMTILAISLAACAGGQSRPAENNYARIAVLNYANQTGSTDFDYLSESLGDATRTALRGKFDFREVEMPLPRGAKEDEIVKNAAGTADVLILGSYSRETTPVKTAKKTESLTVTGKIYSLRHRKILAEYTQKTRADARIFTAINDIAQQAVRSIQEYTRKINDDQAAIDPKTGKEALTLERLKLKVFVPPMF